MKTNVALLIFIFLMLDPKAQAQEHEESEGLSSPVYTDPIPDKVIDRRVAGEIDSFSGETSGNTNSCGSCGP